MKNKTGIKIAALALLLLPLSLKAQGPTSPEEVEKKMMEAIDAQVQKLTDLLDLEYWQVFYVDSTLNHDYHALNDEFAELQKAKVSNPSVAQAVSDKWMERIDSSFMRYFTPEQWEKYTKSIARRERAERAKRRGEIEKPRRGADKGARKKK